MASHAHEYDCIVCGAHFENGEDLERHNKAEHLRNAKGMEVPRQDDGRPNRDREDDRT